MIPIVSLQNNLDNSQQIQNEISSLIKNPSRFETYAKREELIKKVDSKIYDLIKITNLGELPTHFINELQENYFAHNRISNKTEIKFWNMYKKLDNYIRAEASTKLDLLKEFQKEFRELNKENKMSLFNKGFITTVYLSDDPEIINLFYQNLPIPPLSIFDKNNQPPLLIKRESERNTLMSEFNARNEHDPFLEKKIMQVQRHIRAKIRQESECERIGNRYFKDSINRDAKAIEFIEDANTPYKPKCQPELAERIMKAASQVTLFSSISHLCASENIANILDTFLKGRENLKNSFSTFRPACLMLSDIDNGDQNAICFGPDKIDTKCLKGHTLSLEFDSNSLTVDNNPAIFFKQQDLGYDIKMKQNININDISLVFSHTSPEFRLTTVNFTNLQLYNSSNNQIEYYAEIWKDSLISNNVRAMHKILALNFFRFLDELKDFNCQKASKKINEIYIEISKLNAADLHTFILDLGRKMSCSSEFNFHGAYKIDLNALRKIHFYQEKYKIDHIELDVLFKQLNNQNFESLNKLKELAPKIFDSVRFVNYLISKVTHPVALERLKIWLKGD